MLPHSNNGGTIVRIASSEQQPDLQGTLTDSQMAVVEVGSTGVPAIEPLVAVTESDRTGFYTRCSTETGEAIATALADGGDEALASADAVVEHDPEPGRLPTPPISGLDETARQVLGIAGWLPPSDPEAYDGTVGFDDSSTDRIDEFGATVQGRGWGDWCQDSPLLDAWETARQSDGTTTVVVNAHGTAADTLLLSSAPFTVLDGANAVARSTAADRVVVYCSEADETAVERVAAAAERYPEPAAPFDVVTGPSVYRAAEPTMAIEAIEGNHRLEARLRPPGPDAVGLHGEPTVVHTARTVAHLATALDRDDPPNTRLVSVTGDVDEPATVELAETAQLSDALDVVSVDGEFKAASVGGRFGGLTASLDESPDPEALAAAGLGTEGVVEVLSTDRCVVEFVGKRAQFAADTNCGRCVPCREGTTQLAELLRDLYAGRYDADGIEELLRVMESSSICTFGVDAGRPTRSARTEFDAEFRAHADGHCPAGSCQQSLEVSQ